MEKRSERIKPLRHLILYNTIGIIVFSITFVSNNYIDIILLENRIDLRYGGVIFLVSMMAYTLPSLLKLHRTIER